MRALPGCCGFATSLLAGDSLVLIVPVAPCSMLPARDQQSGSAIVKLCRYVPYECFIARPLRGNQNAQRGRVRRNLSGRRPSVAFTKFRPQQQLDPRTYEQGESMKHFILCFCLLAINLIAFAQEPANQLQTLITEKQTIATKIKLPNEETSESARELASSNGRIRARSSFHWLVCSASRVSNS